MSNWLLLLVLAGLTYVGFAMGRSRALAHVGGNARDLASLPGYYGYFVALWCGMPSLFALIAYAVWERQQLLSGAHPGSSSSIAAVSVVMAMAVAGFAFAASKVAPDLRARQHVEKFVTVLLIVCSGIAILTTLGIILSLIFESFRFFQKVSLVEFLFGLEWSPQTALRADQVGSSGLFGAVPLFAGTMLISFIAMCVATPVGLLSAIYLAEYAPRRVRSTVKPILEILAGIPTVVYGFFAALTVAPFFRGVGEDWNLVISSESALAAGLVMGVMIIPFVSSLSDDVISAVPQSMREGSLGLGATKSETIKRVVLLAALPGIVGSLLQAESRAIGETMIVVLGAGAAAKI
ncbi:MAG: phosphate ABC transporter permease subunit PstC, partial [Rhodospirillaceae bacterium]